MKDQFKFIFFILGITIVLLFSCKKQIDYEGPKGQIKGNIKLYDGVKTITNYSGILVTVEGSSPHLQTTTNAAGDWVIDNLTTGIYNLVFSKDSFATFKALNVQFLGGNVPYYLSTSALYKLPYNVITGFSIDSIKYAWGSNVVISIAFQASSVPNFRFYLSEDSTVSYSNYQSTFLWPSAYIPTYNIPGTILSKFKAGEKMFAICYPCTLSQTSYTDMITGNQIYGVNSALASHVVRFTIPFNLN